MKDDSRVLSCCSPFNAVTALTLPPAPTPTGLSSQAFIVCLVPCPGFLLLPYRMGEGILFYVPGPVHTQPHVSIFPTEMYGILRLEMTSEGKDREGSDIHGAPDTC